MNRVVRTHLFLVKTLPHLTISFDRPCIVVLRDSN